MKSFRVQSLAKKFQEKTFKQMAWLSLMAKHWIFQELKSFTKFFVLQGFLDFTGFFVLKAFESSKFLKPFDF